MDAVNVDETLQDQEIIIQPTIIKSDFHISGLSGNCTVEIFSQNGKLVSQTRVNGEKKTNCNISNLPPGIYIVAIRNSGNMLQGITRVIKI